MSGVPTLLEMTPQGKIIAALLESPKRFGELRSPTDLSDRWLALKLKELTAMGIIQKSDGKYLVPNPAKVLNANPAFVEMLSRKTSLETKVRLMAEELRLIEGVLAIVLFGSVAKGQETEESDIDLLLVTEHEMERKLNQRLYELMFKHDVAVESVFLTFEDLLMNLQSETNFAFSLLEGCIILYDQIGLEALLLIKRKQILEKWTYDDEAETWIQKKLIPTLKPLGTRRKKPK